MYIYIYTNMKRENTFLIIIALFIDRNHDTQRWLSMAICFMIWVFSVLVHAQILYCVWTLRLNIPYDTVLKCLPDTRLVHLSQPTLVTIARVISHPSTDRGQCCLTLIACHSSSNIISFRFTIHCLGTIRNRATTKPGSSSIRPVTWLQHNQTTKAKPCLWPWQHQQGGRWEQGISGR